MINGFPPDVATYWAKLKSGQPGSFHPLICHRLDVASVALALWHEVLSPAARMTLTAALGLPDERTAGSWLAFLAGLHDLGKACPAFQLRPEAGALAPLYGEVPSAPPRVGGPTRVGGELRDRWATMRLEPSVGLPNRSRSSQASDPRCDRDVPRTRLKRGRSGQGGGLEVTGGHLCRVEDGLAIAQPRMSRRVFLQPAGSRR